MINQANIVPNLFMMLIRFYQITGNALIYKGFLKNTQK